MIATKAENISTIMECMSKLDSAGRNSILCIAQGMLLQSELDEKKDPA